MPEKRRSTLLAAWAVVVLCVSVTVPASADEYDDQRARTQDQQRAVGLSLEELDELLEDTDAALVTAYAELETIKSQIPVAQALVQAAEEAVVQLQREAAILGERLLVAQQEASVLSQQISEDTERALDVRSSIGQMARAAYKGSISATSMAMVLESTTAEDVVDASEMAGVALRIQTQALRDLEQVRGTSRNRHARLDAVSAEVAELKAATDAKVADAEEARVQAVELTAELDALLEEQEAKAQAIEAQRGAQLARQQEHEAQQAALEAELQAIVQAQQEEQRRQREAAEAAAAQAAAAQAAAAQAAAAQAAAAAAAAGKPAPAQPAAPPVPAAPPAPVAPPAPAAPVRRGVLAPPSPMKPPVITSPYGYRIHPIYGYRKLHAGTDFRAYCGTPIIAAASGTVQWAKSVGGFGNQVLLNHGSPNGTSLMTSYNHLSSFALRTGDQVIQGQVVGYSGTTGTSTACHLHFEVYVDGSTVDPETLL